MNSGEVGSLWVDESRCQPKFRPTSTPCGPSIQPVQICARHVHLSCPCRLPQLKFQPGYLNPQTSALDTPKRLFQSNKCKIAEGKFSRSTFHPPSGGKEHTKTGTMSTMPGRLSTTSGDTPKRCSATVLKQATQS